MSQTMIPPCGQRDCPNPHPVRPWVERARDAGDALEGGAYPAGLTRYAGEQGSQHYKPEWLRRLQPKDMTGAAR